MYARPVKPICTVKQKFIAQKKFRSTLLRQCLSLISQKINKYTNKMNQSEFHAKYFTLQELTASAAARRHGIDNTPTPKIIDALQALATNVLDPIRLAWGRPVIVTSGYRCPRLNTIVGGAAYSQHRLGQAADIRTVTDHPDDNMALLRCIIESKVPFDKLIAEYVDDKGRPDWIHISFSEKRRGMMLTCRKGKYTSGIKAGQRL